MSRLRQDNDAPTDEKFNDIILVNLDTFSDDESDSSTDVNSDIFFDRGNEDTDDEILLFDDEKQDPPEYYLVESASLDVSRLR